MKIVILSTERQSPPTAAAEPAPAHHETASPQPLGATPCSLFGFLRRVIGAVMVKRVPDGMKHYPVRLIGRLAIKQRTQNHGVRRSTMLGPLVWLSDWDLVDYTIFKFPPSVFRFFLKEYCPESWNGLIVSTSSRERLVDAEVLHPSVFILEGHEITHSSDGCSKVHSI